MHGHVLVCGDDALATRIIDELNDAEISVVPVASAADLTAAGVGTADALIAASADDALNLEMALLARQANSRLRVVTRLSNTVLREALADSNGPGAVLDVADLAAPSVVEALLGLTTHTVTAGGTEFVVSGTAVPRDATLRELYGDLAPVAVLCGENSPTPGEVIPCPRRETTVHRGDWTTMIGSAEDLAAYGIAVDDPVPAPSPRRSRVTRVADATRALHNDMHPMFYPLLGAAALLLIGSVFVLRYGYDPGMSWVDALYFASETVSTTGFGDYSLLDQPVWIRLWAVAMMLLGAVGSALIVAFAADVLLSRRIAKSASVQQVSHLRRHCVIVGLGAFGTRVMRVLRDAGHDVVVIERNENSRYLGAAQELGVPVIFGDATMPETLQFAGATRAGSIAVLTESDMTNIETGIVARAMLGPGQAPGNHRVPIVMRIYDRALGRAVGRRLGFNYVRSTVDLATPWFMGAAMGLDVLSTFSVGQRSFMVGSGVVHPGSELDGMTLSELPIQIRVVAIGRPGAALDVHPGAQSRFRAEDVLYMAGPFRELLATLRRGRQPGDAVLRRTATGSSPEPGPRCP